MADRESRLARLRGGGAELGPASRRQDLRKATLEAVRITLCKASPRRRSHPCRARCDSRFKNACPRPLQVFGEPKTLAATTGSDAR